MKCFVLLALLVGLAVAMEDEFFNEVETKWKKWSEWKAYETCYGREFMEEFQIRSKKATQKCAATEVVELKVWEMLKPERLIMAMMRGMKEKQEKKVQNMINSIGMAEPQRQQTMAFVPFQQFQQQQTSANDGEMKMMMKMMKLMMMKEMMQKMVTPKDMMPGAGGMKEDGSSGRGLKGNDDDFEMANFFRQLLKAAAERRATASTVVRSRREAVEYKDLYDLGDKLVEKLEVMKESYMTELGNYTCWFQEMQVINEDGDLDLDKQLADIETWTWDSQWFKEKNIEGIKKCTSMAQSIPAAQFSTYETDQKFLRVRTWYNCLEELKRWSCMGLDIRRMLERHFGSTEDLIAETGMDEDTLLYLTQAIIDESM